jgi:DNA polymerase III subunit gamma/tau
MVHNLSKENRMAQEFYKKYRPKNFNEIVGQASAVNMLRKMAKKEKIPHTILLTGPSGCGKTTIARILKTQLQCAKHDFKEINCALSNSVMDDVRFIQESMDYAPMHGPCRMWYLDEVQSLSRSTFAQQALLKMLEDTPAHVYFILAATDPQKIIKTIRTRSTEIVLKLLNEKEIQQVIERVAEAEEIKLSDEVMQALVQYAEGSARKALVLLNQIAEIKKEEDQLNALASTEGKKKSIDLCRMLIKSKQSWTAVAKLLKELDEEPEDARRAVLGYAAATMLSAAGNKRTVARCALIIEAFEANYYDSGKAGLINSCYVAMSEGE